MCNIVDPSAERSEEEGAYHTPGTFGEENSVATDVSEYLKTEPTIACYEQGVVPTVDAHGCSIGKVGARTVISGFGVINSTIGAVDVDRDGVLSAVTLGQAGMDKTYTIVYQHSDSWVTPELTICCVHIAACLDMTVETICSVPKHVEWEKLGVIPTDSLANTSKTFAVDDEKLPQYKMTSLEMVPEL